jgi:hypothetical protein
MIAELLVKLYYLLVLTDNRNLSCFLKQAGGAGYVDFSCYLHIPT